MSAINIDCYGRSFIQDLTVQTPGQIWRFVYDPSKKNKLRFTAGLFLDRGVLHRRALYRYPASRTIALLLESPNEPQFQVAPEIESLVSLFLTHDSELLTRGPKFQRFDYGMSWVNNGVPLQSNQKKRLVSFIGSIVHPDKFGYKIRKDVASRFISDGRVDCFGKGILEVDSKEIALKDYCFSIAMENAKKDFYYTEKLIDCFVTKTVPIYWGCSGIGEIFDVRGMILFDSLDELEEIVSGLSFEKYELMRPFVEANASLVAKLRLSNYTQLYTRLAERIGPFLANKKPLPTYQNSKPMAALRFVYNKITSII